MSDYINKALEFLDPYLNWFKPIYHELAKQAGNLASLDKMASNDMLASLLFFLLEIVLVLIGVIVFMMISSRRKRSQDVSLAKDIKNRIASYLPKRKENLRAMISELVPHDEEWAAKTAQEAVDYEKGIYSRILKIIMRQELDVAMNITNDVERLGEGYKRILSNLGDGGVGGGGDENEKISELKSIVAKLRKEKQKLQDELEESIKSVDGIVKEYSRMYSDAPHKEGVEHLEKELAHLRDKVGAHLEGGESPAEDNQSPGEIIDLQAEVPEAEIPELDESGEAEAAPEEHAAEQPEEQAEEQPEEQEEVVEVDPSPALMKLKEKIGFGKKKDEGGG